MESTVHRLAIFASGNGTNAQRIAGYFRDHPSIRVTLILSNNPDAYVLTRARILGIPCEVFDRNTFYNTDTVPALLSRYNTDYIILAGFLWLIPGNILTAYAGRIINIHPALLPAYGGKGMYGNKVHEAVIMAGEKESGITIHYVNERYDEGRIIFQAKCSVSPGDSPEMLAGKIHELEYTHFPEVIEKTVLGQNHG